MITMRRLESLLDYDDQRKVAMYVSADTAKVIYVDGSVDYFQWIGKSPGWDAMGWQLIDRWDLFFGHMTVMMN